MNLLGPFRFVGVVNLLLIEGCKQMFESQWNNVLLVLGFSKKNWITGKIHSSVLHLVKSHWILQQAPVEKLLLVGSRGSTTKNVQPISLRWRILWIWNQFSQWSSLWMVGKCKKEISINLCLLCLIVFGIGCKVTNTDSLSGPWLKLNQILFGCLENSLKGKLRRLGCNCHEINVPIWISFKQTWDRCFHCWKSSGHENWWWLLWRRKQNFHRRIIAQSRVTPRIIVQRRVTGGTWSRIRIVATYWWRSTNTNLLLLLGRSRRRNQRGLLFLLLARIVNQFLLVNRKFCWIHLVTKAMLLLIMSVCLYILF